VLSLHALNKERIYIPVINICNYLQSFLFSMCYEQILVDPRYKVIFKNTLDKLVEEIRRKQLMNVSPREIVCERLKTQIV
jgi:hypothetical protein